MAYTIPSGWHYSIGVPSPHLGITELNFTVKFDSSCNYVLTQSTCINDVNKAYGFGYGDHRQNSVRLGWRVNSLGKLELFLFVHENGKMKIKRIGTSKTYFDFNITYNVSIKVDTILKEVTMSVNNYKVYLAFDVQPALGYYLKPYFGGDCTAPHTMKIYIN
jgi:hypothetical protein